jgi:hypothetical protein
MSGSIRASLGRVLSTALGTNMMLGAVSGTACHPGGSLLKSRTGGGVAPKACHGELGIAGAGVLVWQNAVVPAQRKRLRIVMRIAPSNPGKRLWLASYQSLRRTGQCQQPHHSVRNQGVRLERVLRRRQFRKKVLPVTAVGGSLGSAQHSCLVA